MAYSKVHTVKTQFPYDATILGVNASCVSGEGEFEILINSIPVSDVIEFNTSSGNTTLGDIEINENDLLEIDISVDSLGAFKSLRCDFAYIKRI